MGVIASLPSNALISGSSEMGVIGAFSPVTLVISPIGSEMGVIAPFPSKALISASSEMGVITSLTSKPSLMVSAIGAIDVFMPSRFSALKSSGERSAGIA